MRRITIIVAALVLIGVLPATSIADDDDQLGQLIALDVKGQQLVRGLQFIEGPVWSDDGGGYLIFSDIPANELKKWDGKALSTFRTDTHGTNGNTRDREGRLVSCEHTSRRVTRTKDDGTVEVLVDRYDNRRFNSPNDVIVKSDGTVWFTDPTYGLPKDEKKELPANFVFCFDPETKYLKAYPLNFDQPNGLCFSRDEKTLYIADSGKPHHIRSFDVSPLIEAGKLRRDGRADVTEPKPGQWQLSNDHVFATIDKGVPDGIRCDERGNIWSSAGDGVHIFAPTGRRIGRITVAESPANLCFGGPDGTTLFMTARTSLYSIQTLVHGAPRPKE